MEVIDLLKKEELADIAARSINFPGLDLPSLSKALQEGFPDVIYYDASHTTLGRSIYKELRLLICTNDKKYEGIKSELTKVGPKSQTTIVSVISAAVASSLGLAAGAAVPIVALILLAMVSVGKNVFCSMGDDARDAPQ